MQFIKRTDNLYYNVNFIEKFLIEQSSDVDGNKDLWYIWACDLNDKWAWNVAEFRTEEEAQIFLRGLITDIEG